MPTPKRSPSIAYPAGEEGLCASIASPDVRALEVAGRLAVQCTSAHGRIELPRHPFSRNCGHLSLWFCPVEELSQHPMIWRTWASNKIGHTVPLVTDEPDTPEAEAARFSVFWQPSWGHPFFVKFARGRFFPDMHTPEPRFFIEGWIATLRRHHWYRLDLAFDHERAYHALWINGILAGRSNQHGRSPASFEPCGPRLFLRSPQIAYGTVELHEAPLPEKEIPKLYAAEAPAENTVLDRDLKRELTGKGNPRGDLHPAGDDWSTDLELDLCDPDQADHFHLQGCPDCLHWEPEGLRVLTPQVEPYADKERRETEEDPMQMYLWSREVFEGDLYIACDFMPLRRGGLSILIPRASGMQGEDFMADYPPRTSGSMQTIHTSDVRMYHWEFFREMDDVRNDVPTHAIVKWPWEIVLVGGVAAEPFRFGEWNRIEYLQVDDRIQGAVNGEIVLDGRDEPYSGKGPVLRHGRFAIRCMIRTDIRLRNLVVRTR